MPLTYEQRKSVRGMLKDKQSAKTIAEEYECDVEEVEALAAPKAVSCRLVLRAPTAARSPLPPLSSLSAPAQPPPRAPRRPSRRS
jgi:hypothetical protein